jgi:hypothetical protein
MEEVLLGHKQSNNAALGSKPVGAVTSSAHIKNVTDKNENSMMVGTIDDTQPGNPNK